MENGNIWFFNTLWRAAIIENKVLRWFCKPWRLKWTKVRSSLYLSDVQSPAYKRRFPSDTWPTRWACAHACHRFPQVDRLIRNATNNLFPGAKFKITHISTISCPRAWSWGVKKRLLVGGSNFTQFHRMEYLKLKLLCFYSHKYIMYLCE